MSINDETILSCIEIEPAKPANKSIIWLHGLGADGNDFVPIASELTLPNNVNMRFIFPHAPIMPVTINNGFEMRAWYDIYGIDIHNRIDNKGIAQSIARVEKLIDREIARGMETNHIFLAGFSQGAAIALMTGLYYAKPLAGIIALSGYFPSPNELPQKASTANYKIPIFQAHGTQDTILPFALGNVAHALLMQAGYSVSWHSYPMPHSVCLDEIKDISKWLGRVSCLS